jgi:RNA polymerase sigma factor, sigma-70 family
MAEWADALNGDAAAFASIFDRHKARVFRHAVYQLGHREDAEDATAAAFLELWRRRKHVTVLDGSVLPWLLVTTTNLSRNVGRSRRRYGDLLKRLPRGRDAPDDTEEIVQSRIDAQRQIRDLVPAFDRLSEQDRSLLVLIVFEDLPIATAALALGMTAPTARSRLHRMRARLRHQLESSSEVR